MFEYDSEKRRRALRDFMNAHNLTVHKWASSAGVSASSIYDFLNGRTRTLTDLVYEALASSAGVESSLLRNRETNTVVPRALSPADKHQAEHAQPSPSEVFNPAQRRAALADFIKARRTTVNAVARASGISEAGLRAFLHGRTNSLSERSYAALAAAFKTTPAVLRGERSASGGLTLLGYVVVGDCIFPPEDDDISNCPLLRVPSDLAKCRAVIVQGSSLLPRFSDGDVIFFDHLEMAPDRALGHVCVVQVENGPMLLKRPMRGTRRNRYHLMSINPAVPMLEDQSLLWAAKIRWVQVAD